MSSDTQRVKRIGIGNLKANGLRTPRTRTCAHTTKQNQHGAENPSPCFQSEDGLDAEDPPSCFQSEDGLDAADGNLVLAQLVDALLQLRAGLLLVGEVRAQGGDVARQGAVLGHRRVKPPLQARLGRIARNELLAKAGDLLAQRRGARLGLARLLLKQPPVALLLIGYVQGPGWERKVS